MKELAISSCSNLHISKWMEHRLQTSNLTTWYARENRPRKTTDLQSKSSAIILMTCDQKMKSFQKQPSLKPSQLRKMILLGSDCNQYEIFETYFELYLTPFENFWVNSPFEISWQHCADWFDAVPRLQVKVVLWFGSQFERLAQLSAGVQSAKVTVQFKCSNCESCLS